MNFEFVNEDLFLNKVSGIYSIQNGLLMQRTCMSHFGAKKTEHVYLKTFLCIENRRAGSPPQATYKYFLKQLYV